MTKKGTTYKYFPSTEKAERFSKEDFLERYFSLILSNIEGLGKREKLTQEEKEKLYKELQDNLTMDILRVGP